MFVMSRLSDSVINLLIHKSKTPLCGCLNASDASKIAAYGRPVYINKPPSTIFLQAAAGTTSLKPRKNNLESPNKGMYLLLLLCFKSLEWRSSSPLPPRSFFFCSLSQICCFSLSPPRLPSLHVINICLGFQPVSLKAFLPAALNSRWAPCGGNTQERARGKDGEARGGETDISFSHI